MSPITVLHGRPTPEELAVVVALVSARPAAAVAPRTGSGPASAWANRSRVMGRRPHPGPYAWRTSARPR